MMVQNPFNHDGCDHHELAFPVAITEYFYVDLLTVLGNLWKYCMEGDVAAALIMVETLGEWIQKTLMGLDEEVDTEVKMYRGFGRDMKKLQDDEGFDAELRKLLGENE